MRPLERDKEAPKVLWGAGERGFLSSSRTHTRMTIYQRSRIPGCCVPVKSPVHRKSFSRSTDRNPTRNDEKTSGSSTEGPSVLSDMHQSNKKKDKVQSCPCHWTRCGLPNNRELLQLGGGHPGRTANATQAMALTLLQGAVYITWSKSKGHQQADCSRSLVHIHCCRCLLPVLLVQCFIEIFVIYCVCALARDSLKSGIFSFF